MLGMVEGWNCVSGRGVVRYSLVGEGDWGGFDTHRYLERSLILDIVVAK